MTDTKFVLSIAGKKRSGKDTAAKFLKEEFGFQPIALAAPFKHHIFECSKEGLTRRELSFADINGETDFDRDHERAFTMEQFREIALKSLERWSHKILPNSQFTGNKWADFHRMVILMDKHRIGIDRDTLTIRRLMQFIGTDLWVNECNRMIWVEETWRTIRETESQKFWIITDCRQDHELQWMRTMGVRVLGLVNPNAEAKTGKDSHVTERGLRLIPGVDPVIKNDETLEVLRDRVVRCVTEMINTTDGNKTNQEV